MGRRLELNSELLKFVPNVYFQPPSNVEMSYPCIVYNKTGKWRRYGNNDKYASKQTYQIMLIESNPESSIADDIENHFEYCFINQYYIVDNLNHTTLTLNY